jgi:hypothetical protein
MSPVPPMMTSFMIDAPFNVLPIQWCDARLAFRFPVRIPAMPESIQGSILVMLG